MEQHGGQLVGLLPSDACRSAVTSDFHWLSTKLYTDKVMSTCVGPSLMSHSWSDIDRSTDIHDHELPVGCCDQTSSMGGQIVPLEDRRQSGSVMSSLVDLTGTVCTAADSSGVRVATDHPGELPEIKSKKLPTHGHSVDDIDDNDEVHLLGNSSVCSICGDVAAGFHCGAYVCEACKVSSCMAVLHQYLM